MADKRPEFTVTDRRLFTPDGELRNEAPENGEKPSERPPSERDAALTAAIPSGASPTPSSTSGGSSATQAASSDASDAPPVKDEADAASVPPPTAEEQRMQAEAYSKSTSELDSRLRKELDPGQMEELEITFERFLASLYMTALMQLGLAHEQGGGPRIDLIGARQTIDSISLLQQKTKGNLTDREKSFIQSVLYELRMAYLEVTNALAHGPGPQSPGGEAGPPRR
jgi:hypothetical protein